MGVHVVTQSLALLLIAITTSQFMPPSSLPYPFQNGQPPMQMMQMSNGPHMMQMPNGPQMMQLPNGQHMMQMPAGGPMMPHMPRLPGGPPGQMPMPMPMPFPMNGGRMPMVVMPHSKKTSHKSRRRRRKPRRKRINIGSSSSDTSCSESAEYRRSRNKLKSQKNSRREGQVLTPVISYVTKDGFVVYQKKIKKDKARDWLEMTKREEPHNSREFKEKIRINN